MNSNLPLTLTRRVAAVSMAVALGASIAPAFASEKPVTHKYKDADTVTQYNGWDDPVMANVAAYAGRALVRHLQTAKSLLAVNDISEASGKLASSQDFATAIQTMMPYVITVDKIRNARNKLVNSSSDVFYDDMLPIYANLDQMEVYAPKVAQKARKGIKQAEQHVRHGNRKAAAKKLKEVADDIANGTVYLPVDLVVEQIRAARTALDKKQPDVATAKKAVNNALNSLVSVVDDFSIMPPKSAKH